MSKSSVSSAIASIKSVSSRLNAELQVEENKSTAIQTRFIDNYDLVKKGVLGFVKTMDASHLSQLSTLSEQGSKAFNFKKFVSDTNHNNQEIRQDLERFHAWFGDIALPPDSGKAAVAHDGLTAEEIKKRLEDSIERRTSDRRLVKLGHIVVKRGNVKGTETVQSLENAQAFLESCRKKSFWDIFSPSRLHGRHLNHLQQKGKFDALAEIEKILDNKNTLSALQYIADLKGKYEDQGEINNTLRNKVLEIFNSPVRFNSLAPVMGRDIHMPLSQAFAKAAQAQFESQELQPTLDHCRARAKIVKSDIDILQRIQNLNSSQTIQFDIASYEASIGVSSVFTQGCKKILDALEEAERQRKRREEEEAARRRREESSMSSSSYSSFGGGSDSFSGGGGSFGGGGASGSWITSDPNAEPSLNKHMKFDLF